MYMVSEITFLEMKSICFGYALLAYHKNNISKQIIFVIFLFYILYGLIMHSWTLQQEVYITSQNHFTRFGDNYG